MDGALRYGFGVDERTSTLIDLALAEDIGPGDVTSSYFVPEHREARGLILSKSEGVVAGVEVAEEVVSGKVSSLVNATHGHTTILDTSKIAYGIVGAIVTETTPPTLGFLFVSVRAILEAIGLGIIVLARIGVGEAVGQSVLQLSLDEDTGVAGAELDRFGELSIHGRTFDGLRFGG